MSYYADILSVALSDIDAYVLQERSEGAVTGDVECNPTKNGKEKPLDIIRAGIDGIHARIGVYNFCVWNHISHISYRLADTRAAHLDRSRTKAALQRLSMRIFYQCLGALKSRQISGKPRNLRDHWSSR